MIALPYNLTDTMDSLPLKDIHLPVAIGWWPPAPGWWFALVFLVLLLALLVYSYKRLTRKTAVKSAKKILKTIRQQSENNSKTLTDLSALLRRVAISTDARNEVASLQGQAWLSYLDRSLPGQPFTQGVGRCLADAHFRPAMSDDIDFEALFTLCERWLKQRGKRS